MRAPDRDLLTQCTACAWEHRLVLRSDVIDYHFDTCPECGCKELEVKHVPKQDLFDELGAKLKQLFS